MTSEQPIVRPSEPVRHRITVPEFLALDEAGFFADRRVELIDGELYEMVPLHRPHARATMVLSSAIDAAVESLGIGLETLAEPSTNLDATSMPQADIVVADIAEDDYVTGRTVRLVVEVADNSLRHDLGPKLILYARSGVPEYWVADVNGRRVVRFHAPEGETYRERAESAFGEPVPSATIPGLIVDTSRLG